MNVIFQSDEFLAELYNDHRAMKDLMFMTKHNIGGWKVEDATKRRAFMEQINNQNAGFNCVVQMHDGKYAGVAGFRDLHWWNRSAEMGIILHPDFWSKGLATEIHYIFLKWAFEEHNLNRVEFKTSVSNEGMNFLCRDVMHANLEGTIRDCFPSVDCTVFMPTAPTTGDDATTTGPTDQGSVPLSEVTFDNVNLYSILKAEWPRAKESLLARMEKRA